MKKNLFLLIAINMACFSAKAQWSGNAQLADTKVCIANDWQRTSHIVSDGSGGAIIFWEDNRGIYYNKLNNAGVAVWSPVSIGLSLTNINAFIIISQIISDGNGGAFISWENDTQVFVQHINSAGTKTWQANGVILSSTAYGGYMCSDGSGGVIVTWSDTKDDAIYELPRTYAQRISSMGNKMWGVGGINVVNATGFSSPFAIITDGSGGAIISFIDTRNSNYDPDEDEFDNLDIYAQRINSTGNEVWDAAGVAICTQTSHQDSYADGQHPYMVADGAGGAIICWEDYRNDFDNEDIFCQRINAGGIPQWTANGVSVCDAVNPQTEISLFPAGNGGAILVWKDERTNVRLYTQKLNTNGTIQWQANGLPVTSPGNDFYYTASSDATGSSILVSWGDPFNSPQDIMAQKFSTVNGALLWGNGTLVCGRADAQTEPAITHNGGGGAIISWTDQRNSAPSGEDIYANRVLPNGVLPVTFISFEATLQSNYIALKWSTATESNSKEFSVQRSIDGIIFERIGVLPAAGNSNMLRNYSFFDWQSISLKGKIIFYRIMETDINGQSFYTDVKKVKVPDDKNKLTLIYNPVRKEALLNYECTENNVVLIRVADHLGRVVLMKKLEVFAGINSIKLETGNLSKGIYEVELRSNKDRGVVRMLKE